MGCLTMSLLTHSLGIWGLVGCLVWSFFLGFGFISVWDFLLVCLFCLGFFLMVVVLSFTEQNQTPVFNLNWKKPLHYIPFPTLHQIWGLFYRGKK